MKIIRVEMLGKSVGLNKSGFGYSQLLNGAEGVLDWVMPKLQTKTVAYCQYVKIRKK